MNRDVMLRLSELLGDALPLFESGNYADAYWRVARVYNLINETLTEAGFADDIPTVHKPTGLWRP